MDSWHRALVHFVVVDMGPDASSERAAWVLAACTSALPNGRCVAEPPDDADAPAAVAIVRVKDTEGRVVRIEVGLEREERALWSVRELEFSKADPQGERWRSVGLALATLVGEIEPSVLEPQPEAPAQAEPTAPADTAASRLAPDEAAPGAQRVTELDTPGEPSREPLPRPRVFIGVGALAARGSAAHLLRWGGGARGAWLFDSGLQLSLAADYSALDVAPALDLDWLRFSSGVGYRYFASDSWSFGLTLRAGVRGLGTFAEEDGAQYSDRAWSFLLSGSVDGWWRLAELGGLWLELELGTIGRSTRLLDRNGELELEVPFGDGLALGGLWLSL